MVPIEHQILIQGFIILRWQLFQYYVLMKCWTIFSQNGIELKYFIFNWAVKITETKNIMVRSPITICEILRSVSWGRANLRAYHLEIQTITHSSESLSRPSFWKEHRDRFPTFHSNWTDSESVVKPWRNRSTLEKDLSLNPRRS